MGHGKDPRQYGLDFGLWTRRVVADLIERKFGVRLGLTAVGELLAKLGLTPSCLPSFSDDPESVGKDGEFGEHRGEPLDQRQQAQLWHGGD